MEGYINTDIIKDLAEVRKKADKIEFSNKIEKTKKYYEDQKELVEKEIVVRDLLYTDYVDKVKTHMSRYDYTFSAFKDAIRELNKNDNDIKNLKFLNNLICEDFFNGDKEFKIFNIIAGGLETYSWYVYLRKEKGNINVCIEIPVMKNINVKNFEYANRGMFSFGVVDNKDNIKITKIISDSYLIEDIAEKISKYISNVE